MLRSEACNLWLSYLRQTVLGTVCAICGYSLGDRLHLFQEVFQIFEAGHDVGQLAEHLKVACKKLDITCEVKLPWRRTVQTPRSAALTRFI